MFVVVIGVVVLIVVVLNPRHPWHRLSSICLRRRLSRIRRRRHLVCRRSNVIPFVEAAVTMMIMPID